STLEALMQNRIPLFHIIVEAFLSKTMAEWKVRLDKEGVPWAPVQTLPEVIADPQARANNFFIPYDHPVYGRMEMVGNPVTLSKYPEKIRMPAPQHGQHTNEVLLEYGYTLEELSAFREKRIIA
ncbi:MAG: CoA transferase, partial [Dehalococcoidales bacterium]|nr:CoA transferase [Dehalococcoidales bacterium]